MRDRVRTNLSDAELDTYLRANTSADQYDQFLKDGQWPDNVPVPADRSFVNANGDVDWSGVPHQGFGLDAAGNPITRPTTPQPGEVFDRYGSGDGRFTSPVENGTPYSYDQRSLPWAEDPPSYHQYVVERPFNEIPSAIAELPPGPFREYLEGLVAELDAPPTSLTGPIAPGFGHSGGGEQTLLPLSVNDLCGLGMIREIIK
ncbi:MAG: TNT domain-containing protein [Demequinaceae bacterium]|nr:TNT domain-containing protein [Demequinaceae bacterium]